MFNDDIITVLSNFSPLFSIKVLTLQKNENEEA